MTFFAIVMRGLIRRPVRTALTLVGISIGIAAVVALVGMARGFESSWETGLKVRGTDIVVSNMSAGLTPKSFPASAREQIARLPRVAATCSLLVEFMSVEDAQMLMLSAREWQGFAWNHLKLVSGRLPKDGAEKAVVLGQIAAEILKKKPGDPIQIETEDLTVAGIVDGGALVENGCIILALPLFQSLTGNEGRVNIIDVAVTPGTSREELKALCEQINQVVPEARAMVVSDYLDSSQGYKLIRAMSWGTSLLAVLVGVLGVMNTMLMTVSERTHELCVLLALGWKRRRIVHLILLESTLLGFCGGLGGITIGALGVKLLQTAPAIRGLLTADLNAGLLAIAVGIAILVGIFSGLYPAWRASKLAPASVLHA